MKKHGTRILAVILAVIMLLLTGCAQEPKKSDIVGVWKCDDAKKTLDVLTKLTGSIAGFSLPDGLLDADVSLEFLEDNTFELTGSFSVLFYVQDIDPMRGSYTYENGVLTMNGETAPIKIKGKTMTMDSQDGDGHTIRLTFTKQD